MQDKYLIIQEICVMNQTHTWESLSAVRQPRLVFTPWLLILLAAKSWFSPSFNNVGCRNIIPLVELNDASKGFVVNYALTVEVQFLVLPVIAVQSSNGTIYI
ncbi:hypothetical protein FEM48_Zijuj08G0004600 [Ziziphus jujuba var. spinosa]|uniref:Uncharacterized protein n=1 Tax=Ziziphus jujuba var. spinosa TaxID=714518 RepID=A0A978UVX8_ZIZJJ|nr:hypothetical protein FEM48_Zijuj08G0004600 [Ziziphus jujuba var. spinosa]